MKFSIFSMMAAALLIMSGCGQSDLDNGNISPVRQGDEIIFGSSAPNKVGTRTEYGTPVVNDDGTGYFPVYWEADDEIAIYCPQASNPPEKLVKYRITPDSQNPATSSAVTKIGDVGLQWGAVDEHRFYGFYPASAVKGTETDGRIIGSIPVDQRVLGWTETQNDTGGITYNGIPNTDYAYMYAYNEVNKSSLTDETKNVSLVFNPLVTILEIIVNGPAEGGSPIKVTNISVTGISGNVALAGDFSCLISDQSGTCVPLDNGTVTSRISVSCYNTEKDEYITLKHGDKINVKAFIIPNDEETIMPRTLRVTVATLNGAAKSKTLQTGEILPHKVNRVSLPALTSSGTNYWMSDLDPNIYVSELSMPGSKQSFATQSNGAGVNDRFQSTDLATQFRDGVRAFIIQTNITTQYDFRGNVTGVSVNELYTKKAIGEILNQLKSLLDEAQAKSKMNEFVFVQITYNSANYSGVYQRGGAYKYWIEGMEYALNQFSPENNPYGIYLDPVTPDTKLSDVGGKIVLKVNFNADANGSMADYIDASAAMPALFSSWTKGMDNVMLYWGAPKENPDRPEMHWFYSEATHVGNSSEAANLETKKSQIATVFAESVDMYLDGMGHNYWFMNDVGGCYSGGSPSIADLTTTLNDYAINLLQDRSQNASLGIVLLNHADKQENSGALYKSDMLIQTVIDNNFRFALRTAGDTTLTYDASYTEGGNAISWDNN